MSTLKTILRSSALVGAGTAALFMTACASNSSSARYGNVYDYESGGQCNSGGCISAPAQTARYAEPQQVVYADCSVVQNMDCGTPMAQTYPVYEPAPVYAQTYQNDISYGGATSYGETVACPAGTTAAGDGTCMETSYSAPATTYSDSYSSSSYASSAPAADCPAGTTPAGDGTCMQSSYSAPVTSYSAPATTYTDSYSSSSSYGSSSAGTAACPAGTTSAADGTCMQSSYGSTSTYDSGATSYGSSSSYGGSSYGTTSASCPSGSSMQGDGTCAMNEGSAITNSTTYGGYTNSGSYVTQDYMPIRK